MENQNLNDPSKEKQVETNQTGLDNPSSYQQYREETATEIINDEDNRQPDARNDDEIKNVYGWIAIALSAISFFFIPILFAGAGIILGFIARNRETRILGNSAIVIGILSILTHLFLIPLI